MKNEMKITPLPWHIENFGGDKYIAGDAPMRICDMMRNHRAYEDLIECDANAAYIVHCCNLHQEFKALAEHIMAMSGDAYLSGHPEWPEIVNQSRAVLAKAKGE